MIYSGQVPESVYLYASITQLNSELNMSFHVRIDFKRKCVHWNLLLSRSIKKNNGNIYYEHVPESELLFTPITWLNKRNRRAFVFI